MSYASKYHWLDYSKVIEISGALDVMQRREFSCRSRDIVYFAGIANITINVRMLATVAKCVLYRQYALRS